MLNYMKKYGGGIGQTHTRELVDFLSMCMQPARRMPAHIFKHITSIEMSTQFQIPLIATALIKGNATCGPEWTQDNVGILFSKGDIAKLGTSLKAESLLVEATIRRFREALVYNLGNIANQKDCAKEVGHFEIDLIKSLVGKHPDKKTVDEVTEAFHKRTWGKHQPIPQPPATTSETSDAGNMVQYDNTTGGVINLGMQTVATRGWKVGNIAVAKGANIHRAHLDGNKYIVSIISSEGSVTLTRFEPNGTLSTHVVEKDMTDFLHEFTMDKSDRKVEYIANNGEADMDSGALTTDRMRAACVMALHQVSLGQMHTCNIQTKPRPDVQAAQAMGVEDLLLVPLTDRIILKDVSDAADHTFVATVTCASTTRTFKLEMPDKKTHVCAFAVRHIVGKDAIEPANAKIEHVSVPVPFGHVINKPKGAKAQNMKVSIPIIKLTACVAINDSIVLPCKAVVGKKRKAHALEMTSSSKARVSP